MAHSGGLHDHQGAGRKGMPAVRAVAEVDTAQPVAVPALGDEIGLVEEREREVPMRPPLPPSGGGAQEEPEPRLPSFSDGKPDDGNNEMALCAEYDRLQGCVFC